MRSIEPVGETDETDAEPPIALFLDVVHEAGDWGPLARVTHLAQAAANALAVELNQTKTTACLALSSDASVAALNTAYRGKRTPTNVLSFPAGAKAHEPDAQSRFLGDIVLAHETIVREADERSLPLDYHVQHLVVHGLLHLLGYDHETEDEARAMEALESRVLDHLGIPDPYAPEVSVDVRELRKPASP
jgi:probable rRNA maturation factor